MTAPVGRPGSSSGGSSCGRSRRGGSSGGGATRAWLSGGPIALLAVLAIGVLTAISGGCTAAPLRGDILITNGTVLDPAKQTAKVAHLLIRAGRIERVLTEDPAHFIGKRLDARGRFILPAFADMHVHAWGNPSPQDGPDHTCGVAETARLMLYCGVVAFLDLGSNEDVIFGFRDRQRRDDLPGADVYAAGAVIGHLANPKKEPRTVDNPDSPARFRQAQTPAQGARHVVALSKLKADVVKVLYDHTGTFMAMPRPVLAAIIAAAHAHKLKVVVHIGSWKDAADAVALGADAVTHLWDEDDIPAELVRQWVERGVWSIPTQPVQVDLPIILGGTVPGGSTTDSAKGLLDHPLLRAVTTPKLRADYRKTDSFVRKATFWMKYQGAHKAGYDRQLLTMHRGGVKLMAGSDSGNFGVFQGFSLHRELALMVGAGVPVWTALAAATVGPGRFLGRRLGVGEGDEASLLILAADPRVDIDATTRIVAVLKKGRVIDRAALLAGTSVAVP